MGHTASRTAKPYTMHQPAQASQRTSCRQVQVRSPPASQQPDSDQQMISHVTTATATVALPPPTFAHTAVRAWDAGRPPPRAAVGGG
jgi:hypothetical protein